MFFFAEFPIAKRCILELLLELFLRSDRGSGPKPYGYTRYLQIPKVNQQTMGKLVQKLIGDVYRYFEHIYSIIYNYTWIHMHFKCIGTSKLSTHPTTSSAALNEISCDLRRDEVCGARRGQPGNDAQFSDPAH